MKTFLCALLVIPGLCLANLSQDQVNLNYELESIFQTIENNYGPLSFKEDNLHINWAQQKAYYHEKIKSLKDTRDYYFMIADLLYEFKDAHVSISLPSTFQKKLPVNFVLAEDKAILSYYENKNIEVVKCHLNLGDELLGLNGASLKEIQASTPAFNAMGNPLTSKSLFVRRLSVLDESQGIDLERNPYLKGDTVILNLKDTKTNELKDCQLPYDQSGTSIISRPIFSEANKVVPAEKDPAEKEILNLENSLKEIQQNESPTQPEKMSSFFSKEERAQLKQLAKISYKLDTLSGFGLSSKILAPNNSISATGVGTHVQLGHALPLWKMPKDFKQIKGSRWGNPVNLFAGVFKKDGKRVGYLRIPDYMPKNVLLAQYAIRNIMSNLEEKSDYLIIDQIDNPGGMVLYTDMIVKGLVGEYDEKVHMNFVLKPTQNYLRTHLETVKSIMADIKQNNNLSEGEQYHFLSQLETNFRKIEWAYKTQQDLTPPVTEMVASEYTQLAMDRLLSSSFITRNLIKLNFGSNAFNDRPYTKPVTMLINELDISGGDATPAVLKDYDRVKLIGVRTCGAGGMVQRFSNNVMNSFDFNLTTSLMLRKDNFVVENYGVLPDAPFELTIEDYKTGFEGTLDRLVQAVQK